MINCSQPLLPEHVKGLLYLGGIVGGGIAISLATFAPPHLCIFQPHTTNNFYLGVGCGALTTAGGAAVGAGVAYLIYKIFLRTYANNVQGSYTQVPQS